MTSIYILLEKKKVTAPELAERFEVSVRTIYRDIDALSSAGIPVYCTQGKGGGIGLLEDFVMDKSALTEEEQSQILLSLQCMAVTNHMDAKKLLSRLSSLFQKDDENWVYVDFSRWNPRGEKELFETLKEAILNREVVIFDYYNAKGEYSRREAEPMQLYFRGMDWYLTAFCKKSGEIRIFKLKRLKNLVKTEERFLRKDRLWKKKRIWKYPSGQRKVLDSASMMNSIRTGSERRRRLFISHFLVQMKNGCMDGFYPSARGLWCWGQKKSAAK